MSVYFLTCCNPLTPSDGHWAKPQKPRMSAHSRMLWRVNRLMVIGQGRKNPGCQSSVYTLWSINSVWWPLGKAEKKRGCQSSVLHVVMRKTPSYMASGQSRKNPGCQSTFFTCFNASTPSDGDWAKPQKPRMSAHSRMLWRVNRLMVIGQGRKNPGCQSIVFTRCEA